MKLRYRICGLIVLWAGVGLLVGFKSSSDKPAADPVSANPARVLAQSPTTSKSPTTSPSQPTSKPSAKKPAAKKKPVEDNSPEATGAPDDMQ